VELDGAVAARVELLDDGLGLVLRDDEVDDESDGRDELLDDGVASVPRLESVGEVRPQSVLPLEAELCESWQ
jgi:hypothetical protein